MTNIEIAEKLINEMEQGRLDPTILPHFINSLQFGGPVQNPKGWLEGAAKALPDCILPDKTREQILKISAEWK